MNLQNKDAISEPIALTLNDAEQLQRVAGALSSQQRIEIMQVLEKNKVMSVHSIAETLRIPLSSVSLHIRILDAAGLITTWKSAGIHGSVKMCQIIRSGLSIQFLPRQETLVSSYVQDLPIGAYSSIENICEPCGLASQVGPIGTPRAFSFYQPDRLNARVLWMKSGCLRYTYAPLTRSHTKLEYLEVSFEVCTQAQPEQRTAPGFLQVRVNGRLIGEANYSSAQNGRRGYYNPDWWPEVATQHGDLLRWHIGEGGSFLNGTKLSDISLNDLALSGRDPIQVELNIPGGTEAAPGINLFGNSFGDYDQGVRLSIGYRD